MKRERILVGVGISSVFLLAIFFLGPLAIQGIVKYQFSRFEADVNLELPEPASASTIPLVSIEVLPSGKVILNGKTLSQEELLLALTKIQKRNPDVSVKLNGAAETSYEKIIETLDSVKKSGIWNVAFATVKRRPTDAGTASK